MEYNTTRTNLSISEYGRNIQKMINHVISIEDREIRTRLAKGIIAVMGQLNPQLRDQGDFRHKLWDHLFIMADFKLDVDSPYPIPSRESLQRKPEKISYPSKKILFKHYGRNIELIIKKAIETEDGPVKAALTLHIANHLKKSYLTWNRDSVSDEVIFEHLAMMSEGKLKLDENTRLNATHEILSRNRQNPNPKKKVIQSNRRSNSQGSNYRGKRTNNPH